MTARTADLLCLLLLVVFLVAIPLAIFLQGTKP